LVSLRQRTCDPQKVGCLNNSKGQAHMNPHKHMTLFDARVATDAASYVSHSVSAVLATAEEAERLSSGWGKSCGLRLWDPNSPHSKISNQSWGDLIPITQYWFTNNLTVFQSSQVT